MNGIADELAYVTPYVYSTKGTVVFDVTHKLGKIRISEHDRDTYGEIIGMKGAQEKAAELLKKIQKQDNTAKMQKIVVPRVLLVAVTQRGVVQAFDGESGKSLWRKIVGEPHQGVTRAASNEELTAVVVGIRLFVLQNSDGEVRFSRKFDNIPGAGPTLSDQYCYIPMIRGRVESITLDGKVAHDRLYMSPGQVRVSPTYTSRSIAWPSTKGHMYVANAHSRGVRFRLETNGGINSQVSYVAPDKLIATSLDGYVYCVTEGGGNIVWRYSVAEPMHDSAILINDACFVHTKRDSLVCLDVAKGTLRWYRPQVRRILAATDQHVFCMDTRNSLVALDQKSGGQISRLALPNVDFVVENKQTDRVYVGTKKGLLQCVHHSHIEFPIPHGGAPEVKNPAAEKKEEDAATDDAKAKAPAKPAKPAGGGGNDPFGAPAGGNDPFGAAPAKGAAPPQGGAGGAANDPFGNPPGGAGGGGNKASNDPFGN